MLGLVGKGVTFDTGGISIKPADGMERMKDDMAGGAAVACAMRAISLLQAPIRVIGVVPATENMPGGRAIKPGDVLKSASGQDRRDHQHRRRRAAHSRRRALVRAATGRDASRRRRDADGRRAWWRSAKITSGLFGTPPEWVEHIRRIANRAGDRVWPMPLFDDYRDQLKSDIADFTNTGGRPAGSITAALFLKEFTGGLPWVHIDIAGTAWAEEAKAVPAEGTERRRGPDARGTGLHQRRMEFPTAYLR